VDFLKGVSFWTQPGRMTALMGSSGAGKTTLMDVIAGRKTVGESRGEVLIEGEPKVQAQFVKCVDAMRLLGRGSGG
jgi:ABC-type multidrug transport system ATPase subunit